MIAPNKSLGAQLANEFRRSSPTTPSSTSSATTTTTSPRRTSRRRHVHREGLVDQRRDRTAAALGHRGAARPQGRPDRRQRLVHLRPGLARGVQGPDPPAATRHRIPHGVRDAPAGRHPVPAQPGQPRPRDVPRERATRSRSSRRTRRPATGSSGGATTIERITPVRPGHRRDREGRHHRRHDVYPRLALRGQRRPHEAGARHDRGGAAPAPRRAGHQGKLLEAERLRMRTAYDLEMMREVGFCAGIENYSPAHRRPRGRHRPVHAARLLPRRLSRGDRRVARDGAAAPRDVRGRYVAEVDARRARVPPAQRHRQPAAAVRGVHRARAPGRVHVGDARPPTSCACRSGSWSRSSGRRA